MNRPCKACGCPLIFANGPNGKPIPLDAKAQVYALIDQPDGSQAAVPVAGHYVTHFATCPKASEFRKRRPRAPGQEG